MEKRLVLVLFVSIILLVSGCGPEKRPLNTNTASLTWGDGENFLTILKLEDGNMSVRTTALEEKEFTFSDEGKYAFIMYCLNATKEELLDAQMRLEYPTSLYGDESASASAIISWQDEYDVSNNITSNLILRSTKNLRLSYDGILAAYNNLGEDITLNQAAGAKGKDDNISTHTFDLGTISPGEDGAYIVFFVVQAHSVAEKGETI